MSASLFQSPWSASRSAWDQVGSAKLVHCAINTSSCHCINWNLHQHHTPVAGRLFLSDTPTKVDLVHADEVARGEGAQLRQDETGEEVAFAMHVAEGGRDEHANRPPPEAQVRSERLHF